MLTIGSIVSNSGRGYCSTHNALRISRESDHSANASQASRAPQKPSAHGRSQQGCSAAQPSEALPGACGSTAAAATCLLSRQPSKKQTSAQLPMRGCAARASSSIRRWLPHTPACDAMRCDAMRERQAKRAQANAIRRHRLGAHLVGDMVERRNAEPEPAACQSAVRAPYPCQCSPSHAAPCQLQCRAHAVPCRAVPLPLPHCR